MKTADRHAADPIQTSESAMADSSSTMITGLFAPYWQAMLDAFPYSPRLLATALLPVVLEITTVVFSLFFVALERFKLCQKWRVHTNPEVTSPPPELVQEALRDHVLNGIVARPIFMFMMFPVFTWFGMQTDTASLPSFQTLMWQLIISILIDDTWFYWGHRLLHTPWLYRHIHKQHHRFRFTHPLASEFAHPVEDLLVNSIGTLLGPLVLGAHLSVLCFYGALKLAQAS